MIIFFGMAAICFLFRFITSGTNQLILSATGMELARSGIKNWFSANEKSSGDWMVLIAFSFTLLGCCLNFFLRTSELINSLMAALAYLNLFSFRTQKMNGFSATESGDTLNTHFGWAYWLALVLLLIIVIQQVYRFIRWQHPNHVQIHDGYPF